MQTISDEHKSDNHTSIAGDSDDSAHDDHWNGHEFECKDLSLILDKQSNRKKYQLFQIDIEQDTIDKFLLTNMNELPILRVTSIQFQIEQRSTIFKKYFNILKMAFVMLSMVVLWKYTQTL